jgi:hypothetical protein
MTPEQLQYVQTKVSRVRKSCETEEQKQTAKVYSGLYREWLSRYEQGVSRDVGKQHSLYFCIAACVALIVVFVFIGIAALIQNA